MEGTRKELRFGDEWQTKYLKWSHYIPVTHNSQARIYDFNITSSSSWTRSSLGEPECTEKCRKTLPRRQNQEATGPQPPAAHAQRLAWDWRGRCLAHATSRYLSTCFMSSNVIKQPQLPHLSTGHFSFIPARLRTCLERRFVFSPAARSLALFGCKYAAKVYCMHTEYRTEGVNRNAENWRAVKWLLRTACTGHDLLAWSQCQEY